MADDGMLLNFDIGDAAITAKPVFKGGKWKDRVRAKKTASYRLKKLSRPDAPPQQRRPRSGSGSEHSDPDSGARHVKRQRKDGEFKPANRPGGGERGNRSHLAGIEYSKEKPKQIVSSLFTYNPAPTTEAEVQPEAQEEAQIEPSNAPLSSELDTFTSLGLSTTLASHLLNKMGIKAPTAIQKAAISQLVKEDSDAFIQAETGSGKTLAYLLPIVQRIMQLSSTDSLEKKDASGKEAVHRDSGLFAIVLAPTRELSKQIAVVLESLLRCAHWIVGGTVIGGEKKKSEKARLRKGLNILVATPGRLADHLQHTEALDVSNVRWLVLDEGDRLMELGFENDIQKIVSILNLRMKATLNKGSQLGLPSRRTTILCSATIKMNVQRLGEISLKDAVHIQSTGDGNVGDSTQENGTKDETEFSAPAQLKQSYAIVPAKLRLVSLIAFMKRAFARKGAVMKAVVFISCADSVDFHFDVLTQIGEMSPDTNTSEKESKEGDKEDKEGEKEKQASASESEKDEHNEPPQEATKSPSKPTSKPNKSKKPNHNSSGDHAAVTYAPSPLISSPDNPVTAYRLHGSLPQHLRTSTLTHFARSKTPSLLIATDVASRGLDLPNLDLVLEYDAAFARDDHLHRIGRTARAGQDGRACIFLMPGCEERYVDILAKDRKDVAEGRRTLTRHTADELLKRAFEPQMPRKGVVKGKPKGPAWEDVATDLQLKIERWVLERPERLEAAKRGFQGHIRAYATHVASERHCFDIKELHLGHLAKAFALRERPGGLGSLGRRLEGAGKGKRTIGNAGKGGAGGNEDGASEKPVEDEAAKKMREKVRKSKMMGMGADEFNLG